MSDSDNETSVDAFDLRLSFYDILRRLSASRESSQRAASFAIRWKKHYEVLYDAFFEALQSACGANPRMNLFYLCDLILIGSLKVNFSGYLSLVIRDINDLVNLVCSNDILGAANIANVRKVLSSWQLKKFLDSEQSAIIDSVLCSNPSILSSTLHVTHSDSCSLKNFNFNGSDPSLNDSKNSPLCDQESRKSSMSKREIIARMEDDRERHKREREDGWIRPINDPIDNQFEEYWNSLDSYDISSINRFESIEYNWSEFRSQIGQFEKKPASIPASPAGPDARSSKIQSNSSDRKYFHKSRLSPISNRSPDDDFKSYDKYRNSRSFDYRRRDRSRDRYYSRNNSPPYNRHRY